LITIEKSTNQTSTKVFLAFNYTSSLSLLLFFVSEWTFIIITRMPAMTEGSFVMVCDIIEQNYMPFKYLFIEKIT